MTTDANATYYDLALEATTSDGTRVAATVETRDIVRAVLERAGLGADASHQLGKLLERAIRIGAKPGTDINREVDKIAIEAGMLRDSMDRPAVTAEPITDDDAEDAARVERCETCGAKVSNYQSGCPVCGAPTCCYSCCSREELKRQLDEARARIAELEGELDEAQAGHARAQVHINELCLEPTRLRSQAAQAERERDEAREDAVRAERELAGVVDPETLQRWRTALSASPTETLTNAICRVTSELAALRDRYRPRRQSEEPAPENVYVLAWSPRQNDREETWFWLLGQHVAPDAIWTHQPPAPTPKQEAKR